jgi:hypothetical protein
VTDAPHISLSSTTSCKQCHRECQTCEQSKCVNVNDGAPCAGVWGAFCWHELVGSTGRRVNKIQCLRFAKQSSTTMVTY